jgi:hypothetical protein
MKNVIMIMLATVIGFVGLSTLGALVRADESQRSEFGEFPWSPPADKPGYGSYCIKAHAGTPSSYPNEKAEKDCRDNDAKECVSMGGNCKSAEDRKFETIYEGICATSDDKKTCTKVTGEKTPITAKEAEWKCIGYLFFNQSVCHCKFFVIKDGKTYTDSTIDCKDS